MNPKMRKEEKGREMLNPNVLESVDCKLDPNSSVNLHL